jgi:hypothetical protein
MEMSTTKMEKEEKNCDPFGLPILTPDTPLSNHNRTATVAILHNDVSEGDGVSKADDDYEHARLIMKDALAVSSKALAEAAEEASRNGSANSFVSVAQISKAVIDGAEKLLGLSKTHKDIKGGGPQTNITNNTLNISTAEMLKMLKEKNNNAGE